jgi:hypothetical protein
LEARQVVASQFRLTAPCPFIVPFLFSYVRQSQSKLTLVQLAIKVSREYIAEDKKPLSINYAQFQIWK